MVHLYSLDVLKHLNVSSPFKVHIESTIPASLAGVFLHSIPLSSLFLSHPSTFGPSTITSFTSPSLTISILPLGRPLLLAENKFAHL